MTSAAFLLFVKKRHLLNFQLIGLNSKFGALGIIFGLWVPMDPFTVNLLYTVFISAFAILYWYTNYTKLPMVQRQDDRIDAIPENVFRGLSVVAADSLSPLSVPLFKVRWARDHCETPFSMAA